MNQWTLGAYGEYALFKSEKFEIIGQLSAGVAFNSFHIDNFHELANGLNNIGFLENAPAFDRFKELVRVKHCEQPGPFD